LLAAQEAALKNFEDEQPILIAKDRLEPSEQHKSDIAVGEYNI